MSLHTFYIGIASISKKIKIMKTTKKNKKKKKNTYLRGKRGINIARKNSNYKEGSGLVRIIKRSLFPT